MNLFFLPNIFKQYQAKKGEPGNIQHSTQVLKNQLVAEVKNIKVHLSDKDTINLVLKI